MELTKKTNVLIVDDEKEIRESLQRMLERQEYRVFTAADGEEALKVSQERNIDVALVDIVMPKMDGLEFLRQVHHSNPKIEVIMITGQSTVERCVKAIEYGASSYLLKPAWFNDILDAISKAEKTIKSKEGMLAKAIDYSKD
jgi:DNA-binding NtrC family response regulator